MKVVVIGCTHAGTAAIVKLKELHPDYEIVVYERNDNISFLSCGIALNVGKVIESTESLFYNSPENLAKSGVVTKMKHEVLDIDFDAKKVKVQNLLTEEVFEDSYDKLVLTLGSWPIVPKFEGGDLENIVLCKNYDHALNIIEKSKDAKNVIVIGAGYIGVELVEAFEMQGKNVTLIDAEERIMAKYLDKEFTDVAEKEFSDRGVKLVLGEKVQKFNGENGKVKSVVTENGEYEGDLVIFAGLGEASIPDSVKTNEGYKSLKAVKENRVGCIDMILYSFKDALYMEAQYNQILEALKVASNN